MALSPHVRVKSISRKMKLLIVLAAAGFVSGSAYLTWIFVFDIGRLKELVIHYPLSGIEPVTLTSYALGGLAIIASANAILIGTAIWTLWTMFDHFEKGEIFAGRSGVLLRRTGYLALIGGFSGLLSRTLAVLVATYENPLGQTMLSIGISSTDIGLLILAGLLFVLGHIMVIATGIEEDNRSFV
ncbi:DUF2975 family protein [Ciceribacter lividus]|uniref:DUF2975 family protein n=1 Tax=Ciceribacter lividus TaxID=1197950 RepID=A0A6I7HPV5_9HYPH|nr:DUF2975 domain-containing protein [Ciceribacter lividus]RCW27136.1 DUF2975 family protein [Ciceribacter lividus]